MLHKLTILLTFGLLTGSLAHAQAPKPASPEAAAQNRFQDIPVNLYTGTPGIGVPIYTFQEGAITVPIGLSYNASGMRVGEPAGWCGQGWACPAC
jgi:hypothetical protein